MKVTDSSDSFVLSEPLLTSTVGLLRKFAPEIVSNWVVVVPGITIGLGVTFVTIGRDPESTIETLKPLVVVPPSVLTTNVTVPTLNRVNETVILVSDLIISLAVGTVHELLGPQFGKPKYST